MSREVFIGKRVLSQELGSTSRLSIAHTPRAAWIEYELDSKLSGRHGVCLLFLQLCLRLPIDATASQAQLNLFRLIPFAPQRHPVLPSVLSRQPSPLSCLGVFWVCQGFYRSSPFRLKGRGSGQGLSLAKPIFQLIGNLSGSLSDSA